MNCHADAFAYTRRMVKRTLRALVPAVFALPHYFFIILPVAAEECTFPDNVNWVVDESCEISALRIAPRNLSVIDGSVLTVESSGELILDMRNFRINVNPDSRITIDSGGRIRSNQIGPLLVSGTDGGTFGYFLKRVGGPVLDTINPDLSMHPSSTIKTLYMIEALRQVNNGSLNLNTTSLTSCPGIDTNSDTVPDDFSIVPGAGTSCPNSFSTATGGGGGGNCANNSPPVANTQTTCGFPTVNYGLGLGMCAMMKVSNNPAANAIQQTVDAGDPLIGWNNMLNNAGAAIGLSAATTFGNRMGCGGPFNSNPNNQTTLRDLGLIFEQMATDSTVLFPVGPPVPFVFQNTDAYNFMDNHTNDRFVTQALFNDVVNEQAIEIGLSTTTENSFNANIRMVHKAGSNTDSNNLTQFATLSGWISLPINAGAASRDYVYGIFINNATANIIGFDLRASAAEMLRPVIRDALEEF